MISTRVHRPACNHGISYVGGRSAGAPHGADHPTPCPTTCEAIMFEIVYRHDGMMTMVETDDQVVAILVVAEVHEVGGTVLSVDFTEDPRTAALDFAASMWSLELAPDAHTAVTAAQCPTRR